MSGLDGLIRRLMAQRACLERAGDLIASLDGPAVQIGYGDGTAYDHLHEILRRRPIFVIDREVAAKDGPPTEQRLLGDPRETLPLAWERFHHTAALLHLNFPVASPRLAAELAPLAAPLLQAGAVILCELPLELPGWQELPLPEGVREGRHHLYRAN